MSEYSYGSWSKTRPWSEIRPSQILYTHHYSKASVQEKSIFPKSLSDWNEKTTKSKYRKLEGDSERSYFAFFFMPYGNSTAHLI